MASSATKRKRASSHAVDDILAIPMYDKEAIRTVIESLRDTIRHHEESKNDLDLLDCEKKTVKQCKSLHDKCIELINNKIHDIVGNMLNIKKQVVISDIEDEDEYDDDDDDDDEDDQ
jgi:hypothetical protein